LIRVFDAVVSAREIVTRMANEAEEAPRSGARRLAG
jgi:hypothetical protein